MVHEVGFVCGFLGLGLGRVFHEFLLGLGRFLAGVEFFQGALVDVLFLTLFFPFDRPGLHLFQALLGGRFG